MRGGTVWLGGACGTGILRFRRLRMAYAIIMVFTAFCTVAAPTPLLTSQKKLYYINNTSNYNTTHYYIKKKDYFIYILL
jgi:hypothetical protein